MDAFRGFPIFANSSHIPQLEIDILFIPASNKEPWVMLAKSDLANWHRVHVHQSVLDRTESKLLSMESQWQHLDLTVVEAGDGDKKLDWEGTIFCH
jgi:hypothetical protein